MEIRIRRQAAGEEAVAAALAREEPVRLVLVRRDATAEGLDTVVSAAGSAGAEVRRVTRAVLWRFARPRRDVDVLALIGPSPRCSLAELLRRDGVVWLIAGVRYPGNAGFAIRTAEVSGAAGIVLDTRFSTADRRRSLRASMRADRLFPVRWESAADTLAASRAAGRRTVALEDVGARAPWDVDLARPALLVVGGERDGIPPDVLARADDVVRVPMRGFIPSYNLQAAMAAVMAEHLRQTTSPPA